MSNQIEVRLARAADPAPAGLRHTLGTGIRGPHPLEPGPTSSPKPHPPRSSRLPKLKDPQDPSPAPRILSTAGLPARRENWPSPWVNAKRPSGFPWRGVLCVRRCPTLPHNPLCSTIGAERLSFRVRNGAGRFPFAMITVTLFNCPHSPPQEWGDRVLVGSCIVDANKQYSKFLGL
jgi:hypothetical protein